MGYKAFKIEVLNQSAPVETGTNVGVMENRFYKLIIDKSTGSITSLFDKEMNLEPADSQNPYDLGQPVRETLLTRKPILSATRTTVSNVKVDPGTNGPVWESIHVASDLEGFEKGNESSPKGIELEIRLYKNVKKIEFKYMVRKSIITDPEAL